MGTSKSEPSSKADGDAVKQEDGPIKVGYAVLSGSTFDLFLVKRDGEAIVKMGIKDFTLAQLAEELAVKYNGSVRAYFEPAWIRDKLLAISPDLDRVLLTDSTHPNGGRMTVAQKRAYQSV